MTIDQTHDPALTSWVDTANGHTQFPIQNLPLGVFSPPGGGARPGVAIGDAILDVDGLVATGVLPVDPVGAPLNAFLAQGSAARLALRRAVSTVLARESQHVAVIRPYLYPAADCVMHLPCAIGDYTDFYVGIHHATNGGKLFRPDNPLMPNYKYVPVAYHSRASSVRPSGAEIRRPKGQTKAADALSPAFGPSQRLDFELEMAMWIGPGNALGEPVAIAEAADHFAGFGLLNDWSARDIQAWEAAPLGPFLGKNFSTSVSNWIVTPEALAPFRMGQPARPEGDPAPLPYLLDASDQAAGALNVSLTVHLSTGAMRKAGQAPVRIVTSHARHMYWTPAQMVAHHTCGGCDLRPGDLLGTGTISGLDPASLGSFLELSEGGRRIVTLPNGEQRRFLEDGDEIILSAGAQRDGFISIGLGECRGVILPAY
jgi:fumarylacetoacetase